MKRGRLYYFRPAYCKQTASARRKMSDERRAERELLNHADSQCAPASRKKSSEILNAQLPGLFREMHRATRHARSRRTYGNGGTEGRRGTPTGQRQRKRRKDARGDTGCIPSLLSRVSIQRSDKKRAERRAFEFSSQTCVARKKKRRAAPSYPPSPSYLLSCVESRHCFRFEIHRSPLRIVIKIDAIKYIRRHDVSLSDDESQRVSENYISPTLRRS